MTRAVLVVEDSLTVRMDLRDGLVEAGLDVIACETLAEARAGLSRGDIAVAIVDVRLPDGDGVAFVDELRQIPRFAELPVLVLSSAGEIKDRLRALRGGATDFVGKPYDLAAIVARVRQLFAAKRERASALRVLVIDDSVTFRETLRDALVEAGYAPSVAANGSEGLRLAAVLRPAAILVDGVMPDIDGETVIRRLRLDPALRATPCLLLTASGEGNTETRALDAGADAFARKELDVEVILARLATMLRTAAATAEAAAPGLAGPTRVLVVDDDPELQRALGDGLREAGYDVVRAVSSDDALELLSAQDVDCILLDWDMAGIGGPEVCRRVKASPAMRDTPVIALGGETRALTLEAFDAGADDVVPPSAGPELVRARVRAQIRRRKVEDEQRSIRERVLRSDLADQLEKANAELVEANRELEAFSYSVSHDLRTPLRSIAAFTQALEEDLADKLDDNTRDHLARVRRSTSLMSDMIEALLELSRVGRVPLERRVVDVSALAAGIADQLARANPTRVVKVVIEPGLETVGDARLLRIVLDNLIGNAWKFTGRTDNARIAIATPAAETGFVVRDNGVGFDMARAELLFAPFHRLHGPNEFPGTGIGLATVRRIVQRHDGRIWAESSPGAGAAFYVSLPG